jgi:hypothetical protein
MLENNYVPSYEGGSIGAIYAEVSEIPNIYYFLGEYLNSILTSNVQRILCETLNGLKEEEQNPEYISCSHICRQLILNVSMMLNMCLFFFLCDDSHKARVLYVLLCAKS